LRTGDLGFINDGELFITGRLKDLVIVGGQNHYPQDIERTAESSHSTLRPQSCAVFSVMIGEHESVVLLAEARVNRQRFAEVMNSIRSAVSLSHGVDLSRIVLVKPGGLAKTSSGKLQRQQCQQNFQTGRLEILAEEAAEVAIPALVQLLLLKTPPDHITSRIATFICRGVRYHPSMHIVSAWDRSSKYR